MTMSSKWQVHARQREAKLLYKLKKVFLAEFGRYEGQGTLGSLFGSCSIHQKSDKLSMVVVVVVNRSMLSWEKTSRNRVTTLQ